MEHDPNMIKMMEQLERSNRQQVRYARLQCLFSIIAAVCCLALLLSVVNFLPQVKQLASQAQEIAGHAQEIIGQTETVLTNLEAVSQELAETDLAGMAGNVDALVESSQTAVQQATEKLHAIDMETMNKAIRDLAAVVEPLANFFNIFN